MTGFFLLIGGLVLLFVAIGLLRTTLTTSSITLGVLSLIFGLASGTWAVAMLFALAIRAS